MGVVYIGRHETLGHRVVIKVLLPRLSSNREMLQRFFNEAQAATAIRNPGIAQVFDFGVAADNCAYIAMELLDGESLAARLKRRRIDHRECCRIGRQVANVLHAAHDAGIVHRDLKPDNLFLARDGRVKILDFGLACLSQFEGRAAGKSLRISRGFREVFTTRLAAKAGESGSNQAAWSLAMRSQRKWSRM